MPASNLPPEAASRFHELCRKARACHAAGRLDEAVNCYREAMALSPNDHETHNNLGDVFLDQKRFVEAAACYRNATELAPNLPRGHFMRGKALQDQGQLGEAVSCYRTAIKIRPILPQGHYNLGVALAAQGQSDEAIACYRVAIGQKPDFFEAYNMLGLALSAQGQLDEAMDCYRRAIDINHDFAQAHNNLGIALAEKRQYDEAMTCYRHALRVKNDFPAAYNNLGNALLSKGQLDEAIVFFRRALDVKPNFFKARNNLAAALVGQGRLDEAADHFRNACDLNTECWTTRFNLANTLRKLDQLDEAVTCYMKAVELNPKAYLVYNNLGITFFEQGRFDEALACYQKVLEIEPEFRDAYLNIGGAYRSLGRLDEALAAYRKLLDVKPDDPDVHHNLALTLLARGDMTAGWEEYEWRWNTPQMRASRRNFSKPQWDGEKIDGRTLLIHAEQGFGDTIQFCRYTQMTAIQAPDARVILHVPKELVRLLGDLPGVDCVTGYQQPLPSFDFHCPMLSLPRLFGTTSETIPGTTPYLHADPAAATTWKERLTALAPNGPRVGLVWAGNSPHHSPVFAARNRRRSVAPERLAPFFKIPGLHLFNLQKTGPAMPSQLPIIDLMDDVQDFADTAALIANLDLVISVDTAVAHLAGALGKPVWLMNRFDSCWRWFTGRRDSPWYPTMTIYNQTHPGEWDSVVDEIGRYLLRFSATHVKTEHG